MSATERPVSTALKNMLDNNENFLYAHLVKFERPSRPDTLSGLVSTAAQRYTYLTDASVNIDFDDGSTDLQGIANGTQTYLANKVLSVGSVQEQTKANPSNTSLVLDGTAIGANITATVTISGTGPWDISVSAPNTTDDFILAGFREGDKLSVNGTSVNIQSFRANNTIRVTKIDDVLSSGTIPDCSFTLASEEIISILLDKTASTYSSFINREVYIYRAYFQEGLVVGSPILIFKGIIQNVSFEDSETSIKVTWGLGSHWGDFAQVKGRITSDSAHRALDANGIPQPQSTLKPAYAYDKGFNHAELSVNLLSKYTVMVEKIDVSSKKGFLGIGASVKTKKQMVPEDRNTVLDFQLNAKAIPVIYGVRIAEGIPIFADTLNNDSSTVYAAVALSEGEIGGIYDLYIDGLSLICNDKSDYDTRASGVTRTADANSAIQLSCIGRSDRGDVLKGTSSMLATPRYFFDNAGEFLSLGKGNFNYIGDWWAYRYAAPSNLASTDFQKYGVTDGESISLTTPHNFTLDVFTGKPGQKASGALCDIAYAKNFRVQNNYWTGSNTSEYWGPNHKLLDTAYIVGRYKIAEGDTTIPEIKFVVRGKVLDCYNYDYSYSHDAKSTGELADNFVLGESVSFFVSGTNAPIGTAQIIDKWTFMNPDGTSNTRFRFSTPPVLTYDSNGKPLITKFYMKDGSNNTWTMLTYNYNIFGAEYSDSVNRKFAFGPISSIITSATGFTNSAGKLAITYTANTDLTIEADPVNATAKFQILNTDYTTISKGTLFPYALFVGTAAASSTSITTGYSYTDYTSEYTALPTTVLIASKNTIRIDNAGNSNGASTVDDYYKGYLIEVTRYNSTTGKSLIQTAEIIGYNGANRIATIDTIWDFIPTTTDAIRIYPKYADGRVSINPAIQLLDYVTSKSYGRGLDPYKDLDLPSWTEAARKCDTRSDITVLSSANDAALAIGDIYKYPATGNIIWQGTSTGGMSTVAVEGTKYLATFTDNIGKLTNKWNSWKTWNSGDIIYNPDTYQFFTVGLTSGGGTGSIPTAPTATTAATSTVPAYTLITTITLTKVSGSGGATITLPASATNGNPIQSWKNNNKNSGYSLYDADDINYWRLSGWDEHAQRYVTKNQTNISIDTSVPLFDNINALLEHFNGILRYTAGKYSLDVEEASGTIALSDIRTITTDDIIGKIQLSDEGTRSSFNSLTAAFADPANKFEARNVSFFNSEYLKADRNVPKKGNLSIPGITNYYNTRLLADAFLNKSRYGLTISMTVRYHGILMLAGTVIQVIYPRYNWTSPGKKFRIESVNYQSDGLVDIVAKEYDDSFYSLSNIRKAASSPTTSTIDPGTSIGYVSGTTAPTLTTSTNQYNQISLSWTNSSTAGNTTYVEVWRNSSNSISTATLIDTVPVLGAGVQQTYVDKIPPDTSSTRRSTTMYYWIRYKVIQ